MGGSADLSIATPLCRRTYTHQVAFQEGTLIRGVSLKSVLSILASVTCPGSLSFLLALFHLAFFPITHSLTFLR